MNNKTNLIVNKWTKSTNKIFTVSKILLRVSLRWTSTWVQNRYAVYSSLATP